MGKTFISLKQRQNIQKYSQVTGESAFFHDNFKMTRVYHKAM